MVSALRRCMGDDDLLVGLVVELEIEYDWTGPGRYMIYYEAAKYPAETAGYFNSESDLEEFVEDIAIHVFFSFDIRRIKIRREGT